MGMDLRILPTYCGVADFSVTCLECDRDYDLFDEVRKIQSEHGRDVSRKGFKGFMGDTYSNNQEDAYGDILQSVLAKDLKGIKLSNDSPTNRAIISYLNALNDDHECFLYWH